MTIRSSRALWLWLAGALAACADPYYESDPLLDEEDDGADDTLANPGAEAPEVGEPEDVAGAAIDCSPIAGNSALWKDFVESRAQGRTPVLPDFSYAGYHYSERAIPDVTGPIFDVTSYGAKANDPGFDDAGIQKAIDAAVSAGGGVVRFPPGKFRVSPSQDDKPVLLIKGSRVILRGSGSGAGGTEIVMEKMRPGEPHLIRVQPAGGGKPNLAKIVADVERESFWVTVNDTSKLKVGQRVTIEYKSTPYLPIYFEGLASPPSDWSRVLGGIVVNEEHRVAEITGKKVRFSEPVHYELLPGLGGDISLKGFPFVQEVGIEKLKLSGRWDSYPETFKHHKDKIHDSGWNGIDFQSVVNSWVRDVEMANWNQAFSCDSCVGVTVEKVKLTGKKGHTSIDARRGYGVLFKDCDDVAGHHHGPSLGYQGVGTVFVRHKMKENQGIDFHGGVPHATLLDDVRGGVLSGNGGPIENYPNHGRYFVAWNFRHQSTASKKYDFWNVAKREGNAFARPILVGMTHNKPITFVDAANKLEKNESFGTAVTPKSLFDAQLKLRLCPPP